LLVQASVEYREALIINDTKRYPEKVAPTMRKTFSELRGEVSELSRRLIMALALGLGLEDKMFFLKVMDHLKEDSTWDFFRANFYPELKGNRKGQKCISPLILLLRRHPRERHQMRRARGLLLPHAIATGEKSAINVF